MLTVTSYIQDATPHVIDYIPCWFSRGQGGNAFADFHLRS